MKASSLKQQNHLYSRVQWALLTFFVAGIVLFYFLGYRPVVNRLDTLKLQIHSKQRELSENQNRARNLPILAFEVQQLESQVQLYDRQFPRQPELGQFIKDITQVSQQLALADWKYNPNLPKKTDTYFEMPIGMQFRGDFLNAASFIRQVESLPRLTRVRKFHLKTRDWKSGAVEVDMAMNIYFSEG